MSNDFNSLVEKYKKKNPYANSGTVTVKNSTGTKTVSDAEEEFWSLVDKYKQESSPVKTTDGIGVTRRSLLQEFEEEEDDIAPVRDYSPWYKRGLFADGYQFGDVTKSILGIEDKKDSNESLIKTYSDPVPLETMEELEAKRDDGYIPIIGVTKPAEYKFYNELRNQKYLAQTSKTLSETKMDGTNRSILEEMEMVAGMESGKEKRQRKKAIIEKMEAMGIDSSDYALFVDDTNFTAENFAKWLWNSMEAGLNNFNMSAANTAEEYIGAPLKELGWENNPVSKLNDYYTALYENSKYKSDLSRQKLGGGGGWGFAEQFVEGTTAALPTMILAMMTSGASLEGTTAALTQQAAYQGAGILEKAGMTAAKMIKNPQFWLSYGRTYGNSYDKAKEEGADDITAAFGATISSLFNSGIEIGITGGSGIQGLPQELKEGGMNKILPWVKSSLEEGGEEGLQKFVDEIVGKVLYQSDDEILNPLEYGKEMFMGTLSGATLGGGQMIAHDVDASIRNAVQDRKASALTENEQKVFDKVVADEIAKAKENGEVSKKDEAKIREDVRTRLEKGDISTDTIEEVLGGDSFKSYQDTVKAEEDLIKQEKDLTVESDKLEAMITDKMTGKQQLRRDELRTLLPELRSKIEEQNKSTKRSDLKTKLSEEVKSMVQGDRLLESYNEIERKRQAFQADLNKYDKKQQAHIKEAIESGVLNNSNRTRDLVDLTAKVSADTGIRIRYSDTQRIKDAGLYPKHTVDLKADGAKTEYDLEIKNLDKNFKPIVKVDGTEVNNYKVDFENGKITFDSAPTGDVSVTVEGTEIVNAVYTKDGIILNVKSPKYLETLTGHELYHAIKKAKLDGNLKVALKSFAEARGEWETRLAEKQAKYKGIKDADPEVEVMADLLGEYVFEGRDFIMDLATKHRNVFQRIYDEIKYLAKVATAGSKEARRLAQVEREFEKVYRELGKAQKNTAEGGVNRSLSDTTELELNKEATEEQNQRGLEAKSEVQYSLSHDADYMEKAISTNDSMHHVTSDNMLEAKAVRERIAARMVAIKDRGLVGIPEDIEGNTYIANSSYDGTEENTTICPRSLASEAFTDAVSEYLGRPLTVEEQIYISQDLQGRSLTPECTYCYVATDRKAYRAFLGEYINQRDAVIKKLKANPAADVSRNGDLYKEFLNGRKDTKPMYSRFKMWVDAYKNGKPMIEASNLANISKLMGDINSEFGEDLKPQIVDAMKYAQSASWAKKRVNYVAYNGHILKWKQDRINKLNSHYGLRMYSFSDFHPAFVLENMQMITDASVRGLKMLGYTKDVDFVEIFAPTGMNINVSTFGFETNGNVYENNIIGAEWEKAKALREQYPNVGITFVATNDNLVNWALDQDWIDVVIPYHLVRTGAEVAKAFGYTNYTSESSDTKDAGWTKGKDKNYIAPTDHNNDKDTYLAALQKNRLKPRFERFIENPNYMKLVNESRQPASKSKPVQPVFNEDAAMVTLAKLEANGYYQPIGGSVERMYEIAAEVAEDMSKRLAPDVQHSLSNNSEQPTQSSYRRTLGKDVALEAPVQEDVAPVPETAVKAEPAVNQTTVEDLFPDDTATVQEEYENLLAERDDIRGAMDVFAAVGDTARAEQMMAEYEAVNARIAEIDADEADRLASIQEEDAPPEVDNRPESEADNVPLTKKLVDDLTRSVRQQLGLSARRSTEVRELIQRYNNGEFPSKAHLYTEIAERFGTYTETNVDEDLKAVKATLRKFGISVDQSIKSEIADYGQLMRRNFGKIRFSNDGLPVDVAYREFQEVLPGYFPEDIYVPTDQLMRILEVANMETTMEAEYEIDTQTLEEVTDTIMNGVGEFKQNWNETLANRFGKESFDSLMKSGDRYVPPLRFDSEPVRVRQTRPAIESVQADPDDIAPVYDTSSGQQSILPETETPKTETEAPKKFTRKDLHLDIMDRFKTYFRNKGFDFDKVLKNAKNLSTFTTVDNTPQRVMEKTLGYKEGQILADLTVNMVAKNETDGIKWLNSFTDKKTGLLAKISKQYGIKPGSKASAAAQMYAEGFYVGENDAIIAYGDKELAADFPNVKVQENIKKLARDPRIRQIYDETLKAINKSRTRNAYPEIPRLDNYFLHFRAMDDTFSRLGLPFNPNDIRAKDLPTDLNGVTADLKPGQPYFASAMHRTGKRTSFDLLGGLERYLTSAKNQIYHIDDIQKLRALRNYVAETYGQATGLEDLDLLSDEEAELRIEQVYDSHLSTFAKFLNEEANVLAGKTALIDRGLEGVIGRRGMTFISTLNGQVGANMVGYNVSSSLTNFLAPVQALAKSNKFDFVKAMAQTSWNKIASVFGSGDGFADQSPVMIRRKGAERFYRTPYQKVADAGYVFMGIVDNISTELIARTKYNEFTRKGMSSSKAHYETDKWVSRLMGDRSLGQMPQLYNSKTLGLITKFQLEVRNQLDSMFYDTIQETKASTEDIQNGLLRNAKRAAKITSTFAQLAVMQHLFGKAFESVAGYNPAFDIIDTLIKTFGWDDDEEDEDTALDNIEEGFKALLDDLPYTSVLTGGRIPIASALPVTELIKGKDDYGNDKSRWETIKEAAPYYLLPGGYGQVKKTKAGLDMFDDDLPITGSYTDSGNLRFPIEDTLKNRVQAGLFGQWASENARDYFDNERKPLAEKQIQEFIESGLPIQDYWEYREGLADHEKLEDKADYIDSLDLPISTKNLFVNNVSGRKESIDMEDYGNYGSLEEMDFATKNPEKYDVAMKVGGYAAYVGYQEGMKDMKLAEKADYISRLNLTTAQKNILINSETDRKEPIDLTGYENYSSFEEFEFAKKNPEAYAMAKTVGGYEAYTEYSDALNDIKADKDKFGKSISGTRKTKVAEYISSLDIPMVEKYILFKSEYPSTDDYNYEIIDYVNGMSDMSFEEKIEVLRNIGFDVDAEGNIYW